MTGQIYRLQYKTVSVVAIPPE